VKLCHIIRSDPVFRHTVELALSVAKTAFLVPTQTVLNGENRRRSKINNNNNNNGFPGGGCCGGGGDGDDGNDCGHNGVILKFEFLLI